MKYKVIAKNGVRRDGKIVPADTSIELNENDASTKVALQLKQIAAENAPAEPAAPETGKKK